MPLCLRKLIIRSSRVFAVDVKYFAVGAFVACLLPVVNGAVVSLVAVCLEA